MIQDFLIPFAAISLAELGDKTQLAVLCLASQTKKHLNLLLGVILAFILADGLAIILGKIFSGLIPINYIKTAAGIIFITFGIITLVNNKEEKTTCELKKPFLSAFTLIFISEMGDKTQISAGLFAAEYNPILVFIGVLLALTILSIIAVYMGKFISTKINKKTIHTIAGILFIAIGITNFF